MLITEPVTLVLATGGVILVAMIIATLVPRLLAGHGPFPISRCRAVGRRTGGGP